VIAMQRASLEVMIDLNPSSLQRLEQAARALIRMGQNADLRTIYDAERAWGQALLYVGDLDAAYPRLLHAVDLHKQLAGRMVDNAGPDLNLAYYAQLTGQFALARNTLIQTLARLRHSLGPENAAQDDVIERLETLNLAEGRAATEAPSKDLTEALERIANQDPAAFLNTGRYAQAATLIARQLAVAQSKPEADQYQSTLYTAYDQMGRYLAATGDCKAAIPWFEKSLLTLRYAHVDNPHLMSAHARLGLCLVETGHRSAAERHAEAATRRARGTPRLNPLLLREVTQLQASLDASAKAGSIGLQ